MSLPSGVNHYHPIGEVMKNFYSQTPIPVKPRITNLHYRYPLLWGFDNFLIISLSFGLIWLADGVTTLAAALASFFMMFFHCLLENYLRNRLLSTMARKLKERGNA